MANMRPPRYVSAAFVAALQRMGASAAVVEAAMRSTRRAELGDVWPEGSPWRKQWEWRT